MLHCGSQACLFWALFTMRELHHLGIKGALQAGSAFWPRVTRAEFDANPDEQHTHFGYQWSPAEPLSQMSVSLGNLPEVHVWVGLVETQEILDFTTGYWPQNCLRVLGKGWPGPKPPEFYWGPCSELPDLVHYAPERDASIFVGDLLKSLIMQGKV